MRNKGDDISSNEGQLWMTNIETQQIKNSSCCHILEGH